MTASLVESIGDRSVQIAGKAIALSGVKLPKELLQPILRFHKLVYDSHENSLRALLSRNVKLAQSVRNERKAVFSLFGEIEVVAGRLPADAAANILAVASLVSRIYDNSVDIADLVMPKSAKTHRHMHVALFPFMGGFCLGSP